MSDLHRLTRRQTLGTLGAAGAGALLARRAALPGAALDEAHAAACVLTPEQEEGPFYVDLERVRADIVSGRPGLPLRLRLRVLRTDTCRPLRNAAVDLWHCDASGTYSDEAREGTAGSTFLRGVQLTDAHGLVRFTTVYPGFYEGRSTHIHVKVHVGGRPRGSRYAGGHVVHTGQLFLPDALSTRVYRLAPYRSASGARTPHAADRVYTGQGGARSTLRLHALGDRLAKGLRAEMTLGVDVS